MIRELEDDPEVLQREAKEEEQTRIFEMKAERVKTKVTRRKRWNSRCRISRQIGPERDRAGGRTCSRLISMKQRGGSIYLRSRGGSTFSFS